ncbi:MAG: tetratricopeptide repeat protein, partial [Magnetococcales bacterium]|nr:tetratricopeptide repeat protein [Magnetococcales bacterium]
THPLFDTDRFVRDLESILEQACCSDPLPQDAILSLLAQGITHHQANRYDEALRCYDQVIQQTPDQVAAWNNKGALLHQQGYQDEAAHCYRQTVTIHPDHAGAWGNLGILMLEQGRYDEAADCLHRSIVLRPDHADSWYNLGSTTEKLGHYEESANCYRQAIALKPSYIKAVASLCHVEQKLCDWRSFDQLRQMLIEPALAWQAGQDTPPPSPFPFLSIPNITEAEQHHIAQVYCRDKQRGIQPLPARDKTNPDDQRDRRLRIGYLSSDFRTHPLAYQMLGFFKRHDRHRFEIFAYSLGPNDGSVYRRRIEQDVDHFVDIRLLNDQTAAQRIRDDGIDLLIDLNGYTKGSRTRILAYRPAPVQMVHLFAMSTDYIDYLLTDRFFIPPDRQRIYGEKVVYLPHCVIPTDCEQLIAPTTPDRKDHGLPQQGFVFCSFSNHYKIDPHVFKVWMDLLKDVPNSVLWLSDGPGKANLQHAAVEMGVTPHRLIFAPRLPDKADHLARHRWADLFLDTLYYNAQSTACDALWTGVPLLTCPGDTSFAARAGVSLLHAVGLEYEGLIVDSLEQYHARALELATHPEQLDRIRQKLSANRLTHPLFDTDRFVRDFETILEQVWQQHRSVTATEHVEDMDLHRCRAAIEQQPDHYDAWNRLGTLFKLRHDYDRSLNCYQHALTLKPDCADTWTNLGLLMLQQNRHREAAELFRKAIDFQPDHVEAWINLGCSQGCSGEISSALHSYRQALSLAPGHISTAALVSHIEQRLCDWSQLDTLRQRLIEPALSWQPASGEPPAPLHFLAMPDMTEAEQLSIAKAFSRYQQQGIQPLAARFEDRCINAGSRRLRVGYLSCDFHNHATAHLMAGHFKRHDRHRFEVFVYSFGPDDGSCYRQRIEQGTEHFIDIRAMNTQQAAQRILDDQIDLLIDLKGHTNNSWPKLLAHRPAPVQIAYLGYPGSMGADFIGYTLTDRWVTPPSQQAYYSEKLIDLPHCYQVNDCEQEIAATTGSRSIHGLPEQGFVFCCFNAYHKIEPCIFTVWMTLLQSLPESVLWLMDGSGKANLQQAAIQQGVDPDRLVFAPHLPKPDHLARHRWADLFLDTLYYNAHTTASDALWAGVPLLTCPGQTFASRVSLSLLHAVGLEQEGLIVDSLEQYQARALELATHPEQLAYIRQKLWANRLTHPLFDTDRFVRDFEAALERIWVDWQSQNHFTMAVAHHRENHLDQARLCYQQAIAYNPDHADAYNNLGALYHQQQQWSEAIECFQKSVTLLPDYAEAWFNLGVLMAQQQRYDDAFRCYHQATTLQPDYVDAWHNLGVLQQQQRHHDEAITLYNRVLELQPDHIQAHTNLGALLRQQQRYDEAADHYRRVLAIQPDHINAWYNLGTLMSQQHQPDQAERCYRKVIELEQNHADAWYRLGSLLQESGNLDEATYHYRQAVAIKPDRANGWYQLGLVLEQQYRHEEALRYYRQAITIDPGCIAATVLLVYGEQKGCDWRSLDQLRQRMVEPALAWQKDSGILPPIPFPFLSIPDITEAEQQRIAQNFSRYIQQTIQPLPDVCCPDSRVDTKNRRLRIGYLSSDFRSHAIAHLITGHFRRHDRHRFEVFAYSSGPDDGSIYRRRIEQDVDHFIDLVALSDQEAAHRIRNDAIDLLIDLNGYTQGSRTLILAYRPAPVQVAYLGYPGSMGANFIGYALTDRWVTPPSQQAYYSEKLIDLPHCYQVNDCEQEIAATTGSRSSHGLPEQGFVFCCFNAYHKIEPCIFTVWMTLLQSLPESVLWLMDGSGKANLQQAAIQQGVDPDRLVFAPHLPKPDHLARHRWADLFLDTLYYNAHTTASDALWAGVPLLTCPGQTFASRVGLSLLHALGMENEGLIVDSLGQYQARALELATHPEQLARIRQKLWANRLTYPLFDTDRFVRDFETALEQIWADWQSNSHFAMAVAHHQENRLDQARTGYQQAINCNPKHIKAHINLGVLLRQQQRYDEAADHYRQALAIQPDHINAWYNLGVLMTRQQQPDQAAQCYRQVIKLDQNHTDAWYNLGLLLQGSGRLDEAIHHYQRTLTLQADHANSWYQLGLALQQQRRPEEALEHYRKVVQIQPDYIAATVLLVHDGQKACDWRSSGQLRQQMVEPALAWQKDSNTPPPSPFPFLSIPDVTEMEQQHIARNFARHIQQDIRPLPVHGHDRSVSLDNQRLRLGYLSSDFRNHAVAHQMLGIFKRHNRHRFEVWAYSSGPDDGSRYRRQIEEDADHFIDIGSLSDQDAARRISDDHIDLFLDLNGHTAGARLALLAHRPAPVQISWLGYLGTMGIDCIDYVVTDRLVTPISQQCCYDEKFLYMPHSFMVSDCEQEIAATTSHRSDHGLPEQGFVFCCFNAHYKIGPAIFAVWMALLQNVPGSVLWLADRSGRANLQRMATEQGVMPERLIFNPPMSKPDYLACYRHADLFFDTPTYNAGATASGALWMGVPVLTCPGQTFASRVGLSLLHAVGLEQEGLIVDSLEQYQARALELATHPEELNRIRQKLWANRLTHPLFDTDLFMRDLETALEQAWRDKISLGTYQFKRP